MYNFKLHLPVFHVHIILSLWKILSLLQICICVCRIDLFQTCVNEITDKSYIDSISMGMCFVVGYVLIGGVIKLFGRKATIIGSMFLSTACCVSLFWLLDSIAIVVCFIVFLTMPGLCISMLGSAVVDIVPTHLR